MGSNSSKAKHSYKVSKSEVTSQQQSSSSNKTNTSANDTKEKPKVVTSDSTKPVVAVPEPVVDTRLVPDWIKETYFVEILRENLPKFAKIHSFHIKPALGPGENYATLMLRIKIEAELTDKSIKAVSYMMKIPHDSPQMEQMLTMANFFNTENEAYIDLLPKLEEMYREKGLDISLAPRAYRFKESVKVEPRLANSVLMYDLGQDGFKNVNRLECLNMEQTKVVLKKMAQYHAAGAHFKNLYGLSESLMYGMMGNNVEAAMAMLDTMMAPVQKLFLENLKNFKCGHLYYDKIVKYFAEMKNVFMAIGTYDPNEFNVVTHGDSWVNNFLFKLAPNGNVIDMNFVDFQNPRFGHPFSDLLYFLMTSVQLDFKLTHFDYFIKFYHDQLIEHLELLGYTERKPRLIELQTQLYKHGSWAMTGAFMVLPVVLLDPTEKATFDNFLSDTEAGAAFKNMMFTSKRYQTHIEKMLPWLDNRGLLESYQPFPGQIPAAPQAVQVQMDVDPVTPEWVKIDYFKTLLKAEKPDYKEIQKYRVKNATVAGDNYSSILLSVDIDYLTVSGGTSSVSFMLKVEPAGEAANMMLNLMATFKKEIAMYYNVIPQLEQLYKQAGQPVVFGPKCYKFVEAPGENHILLENLRPAGYKNMDRLKGLNVSEVEHVLAKLAKLHAASAQLYATKGPFEDCLDKPLYNESTRPIFDGEMGRSFTALGIEAVRNLKGSEVFGDKVVKFLDKLFDHMSKAELYDKNEFNVLNHGDCWTNNVLFATDSQGKVKDTLLIDFQRSNFNSPAQDLYYFLLSSPNFDIKLEKFDYFIRYYHGELQRNLELLKYAKPIPSLRDMHVILLKDSIWAVTTTSSVMSAVLLDPTDNASIETMLSDSEESTAFKRKFFGNDRYRKHAEAIYPFLNQRGLLEFE